MTEFTPFASLTGGILIGLSAVMLMAGLGRIAGISGIASRLLPPFDGEPLGWRIAFVAGLVAAPLVVAAIGLSASTGTPSGNWLLLIVAGGLTGFGAVLGSGCTSGHGVCGLSRGSVRSLTATATFMATGAATVFIVRHVLGGA
jgi:uncharacterized membrane protein YedE/YeeE